MAHLVLGIGNVLLGVALGPLFGWPGVIVAFAVSLAVGSFIPVWTYHREHALSVRTVLSRSDLSLLAVCVSAAAVALGGYAVALQFGTAPWTRIALGPRPPRLPLPRGVIPLRQTCSGWRAAAPEDEPSRVNCADCRRRLLGAVDWENV